MTELIKSPSTTVERYLEVMPLREYLRYAYRALLGREPDQSGLDHYIKRIEHGMPRRKVISDLAMSTEFRASGRADNGIDNSAGDMLLRYASICSTLRRRLVVSKTQLAVRRAEWQLIEMNDRMQAMSVELAAIRMTLATVPPGGGGDAPVGDTFAQEQWVHQTETRRARFRQLTGLI